MPVIRIEAMLAAPIDVGTLLRGVATRAAEAFNVPVEHCWVTFHEIPSGHYFDGGAVRWSRDAKSVPPLVTVSAFEGVDLRTKARGLGAVAEAVAQGLRVPADGVFVQYLEIARGHVFAGGRVLA